MYVVYRGYTVTPEPNARGKDIFVVRKDGGPPLFETPSEQTAYRWVDDQKRREMAEKPLRRVK